MDRTNKQSWQGSFLESCWQVGIGFFIAYAAWKWAVHPAIEAGWFAASDAFVITCIFTFISLVRGFFVRRLSVFIAGLRAPSKSKGLAVE